MKYLIHVFLVGMAAGCKTAPDSTLYAILNQNFLSFTDTTAYRYGAFLPAPNDTPLQAGNTKGSLLVTVDTFFTESERLIQSLNAELTDRRLTEFQDLLSPNNKAAIASLDVSKITNKGRYTLVATTDAEKGNDVLVGHINFAEPYITEDRSIVILSISSSQKAGRTMAYLLRKENDRWKIKDRIELERW